MNDRSPGATGVTLSIAAVERDTGLGKDTLRGWERRYGFPMPARDARGERVYPLDQVERLRRVKRLLDAGHRPGHVVLLSLAELDALEARGRPGTAAPPPVAESRPDLAACLDFVHAHDPHGLRDELSRQLLRLGLARFVVDLVAALNAAIGEAWMQGRLAVFEEHLYTEAVQGVLRQAIAGQPDAPGAAPRVLLTTLPGEPHGLGLLMAEALFTLEGCRCVSLGVQTPLWDIVLAAAACRADIVALGFSGCMNPNQVHDSLLELRGKLPRAVQLWSGGTAPVLHRRAIDGVLPLASLAAVGEHLQRWRQAAGVGGDVAAA